LTNLNQKGFDSFKPKLGAIIARNQSEAGNAALNWSDNMQIFQPKDLRSFTVVGGGDGIGETWAENTNIFHTSAIGLFDIIWIDEKISLPSTPWSTAFLTNVSEMLSKNGVMVIDAHPKKRNNCQVDLEFLAKILGQPLEMLTDSRAVYGRVTNPQPTHCKSLLNWWQSNYAATILDLCRETELNGYLSLQEDTLVREFLKCDIVEDKLLKMQMDSGLRDTPKKFSELIRFYVSSMAYLFHGIGYKASVIAEIARTEMGKETPLNYLDLGGANGALAGEMLLNPDIIVKTAHTHELLLKYLPLARQMYIANRDQFHGRFFYSLGSMNDYAFDDNYNLVSFIGCLYLSGPDNRGAVARRAFDGLEPGGLLIVHENLRDNRAVPDHDFMFAENELRELLAKLGDVQCFHTHTGRKIDADENNGKTAFWAVRKPG